eukprot:1836058-Pleurochrysis_carterae.AAC.1
MPRAASQVSMSLPSGRSHKTSASSQVNAAFDAATNNAAVQKLEGRLFVKTADCLAQRKHAKGVVVNV